MERIFRSGSFWQPFTKQVPHVQAWLASIPGSLSKPESCPWNWHQHLRHEARQEDGKFLQTASETNLTESHVNKMIRSQTQLYPREVAKLH